MRNRDRRVDVVECLYWDSRTEHFIHSGKTVRKEGSDHGHVRIRKGSADLRQNVFPSFKDLHLTVRGLRKITIVLVPLHVVLEEHDPVPAPVQRVAERAEGSRVPVSPGRSDGEPENRDLHALTPPAVLQNSGWQ